MISLLLKAKKVLNAYEISESVSKRTYFHLHHIDIEPMGELALFCYVKL